MSGVSSIFKNKNTKRQIRYKAKNTNEISSDLHEEKKRKRNWTSNWSGIMVKDQGKVHPSDQKP